jgi:hypothetical protein
MGAEFGPPRARLLAAGMEGVLVAACDQAGAASQVVRQGVNGVEWVGAIAEVIPTSLDF